MATKFQPSWAPKPKPTEDQETRDLLRQLTTVLSSPQPVNREPMSREELRAWGLRIVAKFEALVKAMANPDGTVSRKHATEPAFAELQRECAEYNVAAAAWDAGQEQAS